MKNDSRALPGKARELRTAFDAMFAEPPTPPASPSTALLLLRAGGERVAVKRAEMAGLARSDNVALVPGRSTAFLGLTGLRGGLYPIWSLAVLLGRPSAPLTVAGWLVLAEAGPDAACAFACDAFERLIFVPEAALAPAMQRESPTNHVQALAPWDSALVPVIDLPALLAHLRKRTEPSQLQTSTP